MEQALSSIRGGIFQFFWQLLSVPGCRCWYGERECGLLCRSHAYCMAADCVPEEMWFVPNKYRTGIVDDFDFTYAPTPVSMCV